MKESTLSKAAAELGRRGGEIGGKATTKAKVQAAKANGKLGGRPRQYPKCKRYGAHRFSPTTQRCPCGFVRPD